MNNPPRILVITCAAIAREVNEIKKMNHWSHMELQAISADLHTTPQKIPQAVANLIDLAAGTYDSIFVAYGDCGTSGELDRLLADRGVSRLPGAHCYDFLAGEKTYASLQHEEPGTFYLTDFLTIHFERLVIGTLGLDRFPELLPLYFGHYKRLVYLAQTDSTELSELAKKAATRLNLQFKKIFTGSGVMLPVLDAKMSEWNPGSVN